MSRSLVKHLSDIRAEDGGHLVVICWCRRETAFEVNDVAAYFRARGWSDAWPDLPRRFRCSEKTPWGCGRTAKRVVFAFGESPLGCERMPEVR
jgi:hypothetical protein